MLKHNIFIILLLISTVVIAGCTSTGQVTSQSETPSKEPLAEPKAPQQTEQETNSSVSIQPIAEQPVQQQVQSPSPQIQSESKTQSQTQEQSISGPHWISGFDFCSFLGGSSDCRMLRMFCLDDMGEIGNYDYSKYLDSEACYQYDVTYVQFYKKVDSQWIPTSDDQLARMEAGRPYWCAKDWAKRKLVVCEAEAKASPPPPEPYCGECNITSKDECVDSTTPKTCIDPSGPCPLWYIGKCVSGKTCNLHLVNGKERAWCGD